MRLLSSALTTHIAGNAHTLARMVRIDRIDGTTLCFTDHNKPLTYNLGDGALTYMPDTGILPSALALVEGFDADNMEISGPIGDDVSLADIRGGRFNRARVRFFMVNWRDLTSAPTFVAAGNFRSAGSQDTIPLPAGIEQGDLLMIFVETANEAVTTISGWTALSPQGTGTAGAAGSTRLSIQWKVAGISESAPTLADPGDHFAAQMLAFRGVNPDSPIHASSSAVLSSPDSAVSFPNLTTTVDHALVLAAMSYGMDDNGAHVGSWSGGLTERADQGTQLGNGGGIAVATVEKASAGVFGVQTASLGAFSSNQGLYTIALEPGYGSIDLIAGNVSDARVEGGKFVLSVRSDVDRFNQDIGRVLSPYCTHDLGDTKCGVKVIPDEWEASTAVTVRGEWDAKVGSTVRPTTFNGYYYECTTAGTTDSSEPTWNTVLGGTTTDNDVEWITRPALAFPAAVASVTAGALVFTVDSFPVATVDDQFNYGTVVFNDGPLEGMPPVEVWDYVASSRTITLFTPLAGLPDIGDSLWLKVGCLKRREDCRDDYRNTRNGGMFSEVPSTGQVLKPPIPGNAGA